MSPNPHPVGLCSNVAIIDRNHDRLKKAKSTMGFLQLPHPALNFLGHIATGVLTSRVSGWFGAAFLAYQVAGGGPPPSSELLEFGLGVLLGQI